MSSCASLLRLVAKVALVGFFATPALAVPITGDRSVTPLILAGALPDTPAARVDPNVAASPYSGVVSINIRYDGKSFICSGTLVSARHVVTAGHCIDTTGNGAPIDVSQPFGASGRDVRVVFNASNVVGDPGRAIVTASAVSMHPDYKGFGICPVGVPSFCVNDDVAVITLGQDAPASAHIYPIFGGTVGIPGGQTTLVGYGTSGDGLNGFTIGPDFRIKRSGGNVLDLFDGNDEQFTGLDPFGFILGGGIEVWYADFDGTNRSGVLKNSDCSVFGVCTPQLANDVETNIGGGDSGGPSFMAFGAQLALVANNTFGFSGFGEENPGAFGSLFGGIMMQPYLSYLMSATDGTLTLIPEPGSIVLIGFGLAALGAIRRKRR